MFEEKRKLARGLRETGEWTINEISNELDVSKSTIYSWTKNIFLTKEQLLFLKSKNQIGKRHSLATIERIRSYQKRAWDEGHSSLSKAIYSSHSKHYGYEMVIRKNIEQYFDTSGLSPSRIGNHWFDFVNDNFIIEFTMDSCHGISNAIARFQTIVSDPRRKYLISNRHHFGALRMKRLSEYGVQFVLISEVLKK